MLETNTRARGFYGALGGTPAGEQHVDIGGATLVEVAYGWPDLGALLGTGGAPR